MQLRLAPRDLSRRLLVSIRLSELFASQRKLRTMKKCPYCAEDIQDAAIKCKHCGEFLDGFARPPPLPPADGIP